MSILICPECHAIYKHDMLHAGVNCPNIGCTGNKKLIACDDLMIPEALVLSDHGFDVTETCAGHYGGLVTDFHISFTVHVITKLKSIVRSFYKHNNANDIKFDVKCQAFCKDSYNSAVPEFYLLLYNEDCEMSESDVVDRVDEFISPSTACLKAMLKIYIAVDEEGITVGRGRRFKYFDANPGLSNYLLDVNNALQEVCNTL